MKLSVSLALLASVMLSGAASIPDPHGAQLEARDKAQFEWRKGGDGYDYLIGKCKRVDEKGQGKWNGRLVKEAEDDRVCWLTFGAGSAAGRKRIRKIADKPDPPPWDNDHFSCLTLKENKNKYDDNACHGGCWKQSDPKGDVPPSVFCPAMPQN
ncbi:hypothetical protein N7492_000756 [Penicillium capsulatum]|uniref:Uncharacterized protein n=1 Tax=Penicillium capsulatum TaxID=69766 RepID=A0A9W9IR22_9EURO|nr:hypothetical protein N7492_000756 [Penicillium capsulatum]KAJ6130185.1 hypothetical protein N7512_002965 [Penicillium capsulatum]